MSSECKTARNAVGLAIVVLVSLLLSLSSCSVARQGGCGGNPIHLGN